MFKLTDELINKIKLALREPQLAPAGTVYKAGCFGCSNLCTSNCGNGCSTSCTSGCGWSCAGKNKP